jgi:hypothetical protein
MVGGSSPEKGWEFLSSLSHPDRLWSPPSLYPVGSRGCFQGVKRPGREADYSPPSGAEAKKCVDLYLHSPNTSSWRWCSVKAQGQLYVWSLALAVTKFDGVFSGYRPRQVSVWNRRLECHLSRHHQGSVIGFIQKPYMADSPRRRHRTLPLLYLYLCWLSLTCDPWFMNGSQPINEFWTR